MGVEVASFISALVSTNPIATDNLNQGDDHIRLIKACLQATFPNADQAFYTSEDRTDIASAATCAIGGVASLYVNITGNTTITSFGTIGAGIWRLVRFNAALTLTHNATSLVLPGGATITTTAGDTCLAFSRGSGNWVVLFYSQAPAYSVVPISAGGTGATTAATAFTALKQAASDTATGVLEIADQSEMEAATDTTRAVVPGRIKNHPGVAKAWGYVTYSGGVPTLAAGYNVASISDDGTGQLGVTFTTAMSSASYCVVATTSRTSTTPTIANVNSSLGLSTTGFQLRVFTIEDVTTPADPPQLNFVVFGDQ